MTVVYRGLIWTSHSQDVIGTTLYRDEQARYDGLRTIVCARKVITLRYTARLSWRTPLDIALVDSRWSPYDGVPWEIHMIENEETYREALKSFRKSRGQD